MHLIRDGVQKPDVSNRKPELMITRLYFFLTIMCVLC